MSSCPSQTSAKWRRGGRLPYQYRTLDRPSKEMRVLEILPGSKEDPLCAVFVSVLLSKDQIDPYETISYAWGDPTLRGEIEIDESVIDMPASSDAALRCMRWPDKSRRLWIDAVCIKQDDIPERNFQVKMMGEIYRRSSHNLVYLDEEDASTESAIASIGRVLEELNTRCGMSEDFEEFLRKGGPPLKCEVDLDAVTQLLKRPWFSRMWVIQEIVFAPVSTCYYGPEICIDLVQLLRASSYIYHFHPGSILQGATYEVASKINSSLNHLQRLRPLVDGKERLGARLNEDGSTVTGESGLLSLIKLGGARLCTDPRDKIFSIVGLIEQGRAKTSKEDRADLALLKVDYGRRLEDVLRDVTRFCIQESLTLDVWYGYLGHPKSSIENGGILFDGFCSWVPRLDVRRRFRGEVPLFLRARASAGLHVRRETAMATTVDPNVLKLDGYAVADVSEVSQPLKPNLFSPDARLADTLTSIHRMCRGVIHSEPTRPDLFPECLASTITMSPSQFVNRDDSTRHMHDKHPNLRKHVCSVVDGDLKNIESEYWSKEVMRMFRQTCVDRRIFTGSNGCIGQGPSCLRAGDRIVVFLGAEMPYAVRPLPGGDGGSGERYNLLGSVYVHNIMYGEFVKAAKACGKEPSIFDLV